MSNHIKTVGQFLVRTTNTDDKTIFSGVLLDDSILSKGDEEIWLCHLEIIPIRRFKTTDHIKAMRIDQILCDEVNIRDLEQIECDGEKILREKQIVEFSNGCFND